MVEVVFKKENKSRNPILKKYATIYDGHRFRITVVTNLQEIGMQGYIRYSGMSDSLSKIEPEMLYDELVNFKAGIITEVTPLTYDIRQDKWTYVIYGYGVYNSELTTREIVRNYYLKGYDKNVGED